MGVSWFDLHAILAGARADQDVGGGDRLTRAPGAGGQFAGSPPDAGVDRQRRNHSFVLAQSAPRALIADSGLDLQADHITPHRLARSQQGLAPGPGQWVVSLTHLMNPGRMICSPVCSPGSDRANYLNRQRKRFIDRAYRALEGCFWG